MSPIMYKSNAILVYNVFLDWDTWGQHEINNNNNNHVSRLHKLKALQELYNRRVYVYVGLCVFCLLVLT